MHFSIPFILAFFIPLFAATLVAAENSIWTYLYGPSFTDACCPSLASWDPTSPCADIVYVSNVSECKNYIIHD
jgi:hypothetical protein